ncbi:hypothetical protein G9A89_007199 [Geosiphon pyriformis]|nr:hypothetical protein G9A89_007199 [Geosiphon pyriformis]
MDNQFSRPNRHFLFLLPTAKDRSKMATYLLTSPNLSPSATELEEDPPNLKYQPTNSEDYFFPTHRLLQTVQGSGNLFTNFSNFLTSVAQNIVFPFSQFLYHNKGKNPAKKPLVIVACGSFSPITYLHLRIFEMAQDYIRENTNFEILGGYFSPVSDYYQKTGLAPSHHRVRMCEMAVERTSSWLMVDAWESLQKDYTRTALVLDHFNEYINIKGGGVKTQDGKLHKVNIMLLAGGDLIESFKVPNLWDNNDLHHILGNFGCLIVERTGADVWGFLLSHDILYEHRKNVCVIKQLIYNDISSTKKSDEYTTRKRIDFVRYLLILEIPKFTTLKTPNYLKRLYYAAINTEESTNFLPAGRAPSSFDQEHLPGNHLSTEIDDINGFHGSDDLATASNFSCVINLANTILGTGMLAMPAALASLGLILGGFMICFSAFTSGLGLYFLSRAASRTEGRHSSFFAVSKLTYPSAAIWFDLAIAIKCFGVGISYLIIIGELMPQVVRGLISENDFGAEYTILFDRRFWITVFMIIIVPLAFLKRLDSLRYTSLIAIFAVIYLLFIVVYSYLGPDYEVPEDKIHLIKFSGRFFTNLPIFVFAFTCHQNIFTIYNELEDNSQLKINRVIFCAITSTLIIYQVIATIGYLTFGEDVSSNIISECNPNQYADLLCLLISIDWALGFFFTIGRIAIVILVLFSYPLQAHPCRASLDKVLSAFSDRSHSLGSSISSQENNDSDPLLNARRDKVPYSSNLKYFFMTTAILISGYLVAMLVSKLDLVLAFVGSTGSTTISFILPGIFYYKLHESKRWTPKKILSVCLLVYGLAVMSVCLTMNIVRVVSSDPAPQSGGD